jgi:hypothetical protein
VIDTETHPETDPEPVRLNWDLIYALCADLGHVSGAERAEFLGASRAQLYRWQDGINDIGLGRAGDIAARLGKTLADIVADNNPKPPSPPPPQPRPPAGPSRES